MTHALTPKEIAAEFEQACLAELSALKPGNVHRFAGGHDMSVADFEKSAKAAAPEIAKESQIVGERILSAVAATKQAVGCNTNLGIILLSAPIAHAAAQKSDKPLRQRLNEVLAELSVEDARLAYQAINLAQPGGMGQSQDQDLSTPPTMTLLEIMALAEDRDRIAYQYTHNFEDIVELGLNSVNQGIKRWGQTDWVTTSVYLGFTSAFPDTLIARKFGLQTARTVQEEMIAWDARLTASEDPNSLTADLLEFDTDLKERGLNPGTSADLTVATLLFSKLVNRLSKKGGKND